ncbi:MAG: Gfo/Idh/MocA family protein [Phycisphaerae bacterium]
MSQPLRVAIVGCGSFANRHGQLICLEDQLPELEITCACDLEEDRAQAFAEKFGVDRTTGDLAALCDDPEIDAVMLVTQPSSHVGLSLQAMRAGKPVFCEKPLSASPEDREQLRTALEQEDLPPLLCGYCFRFAPPFVEARKLAAPARFSVAVVMNHETGGRNYLTHNACHATDAILAFHDSELVEVAATGNAHESMPVAAEQFTIQYRFANGSAATLVCGGSGAGSFLPKWYYKTIGPDGQVAEVLSRQGWSLHLPKQPEPACTCQYYEGHRQELRHFVRVARGLESPLVSPDQAMAVDEALAEAAEQLSL